VLFCCPPPPPPSFALTQITDLHRHFIDHLTIPSRKGKGQLRRVDDVFDCWFESGSMPYAQVCGSTLCVSRSELHTAWHCNGEVQC
jgi:isoleucyl-tRNA synthetase